MATDPYRMTREELGEALRCSYEKEKDLRSKMVTASTITDTLLRIFLERFGAVDETIRQ
jgi:hypothetical protein